MRELLATPVANRGGDPALVAREELLPLLDIVLRGLDGDRERETREFFVQIVATLRDAVTVDDLATPFMALAATSIVVDAATLDFELTMVIDEILERASRLATTLAASETLPN